MHNFFNDDIDVIYKDVIKSIFVDGVETRRRGLDTLELNNVFIELGNPRHRVIQNPARKLSAYFLIGEFLWILLGRDDVKFIDFYNHAISKFSDDGISLSGSYGRRLKNQWKGLFDKFSQDVMTRQGILSISNNDDVNINTRDFPCNLLLHFWCDKRKTLNLTTFVRSQDMFLGFPYDVFHWTLFQESVAIRLGLESGSYFHFMSNCHIYDKDSKAIEKILNAKDFESYSMSRCAIDCFSIMNELESAENEIRNGEICDSVFLYPWNDFLSIVKKRAGKDTTIEDRSLNSLIR